MKRLAWLIGVTALAGCDLDLSGIGGACTYERQLAESVSATAITALLADVEAGDLRVRGDNGSNTIRVTARACAVDRRTVDDIDFELVSSGETARLTSFVPNYDDAWLDLTVEVPADFDIDIFDLSGDIEVDNVYSVWIDDGSGDIDVEDIEGDFIVARDGSGSIRHRNVRGRVQLP